MICIILTLYLFSAMQNGGLSGLMGIPNPYSLVTGNAAATGSSARDQEAFKNFLTTSAAASAGSQLYPTVSSLLGKQSSVSNALLGNDFSDSFCQVY